MKLKKHNYNDVVKVKFTLEHATKTQRGNKGTAVLSL